MTVCHCSSTRESSTHSSTAETISSLDALAINYHAQQRKWGALYTSNYVTLEATLLLKARLDWKAARAFPGVMRRLGVRELMVDEDTHRKALESFESRGRDLSLTYEATKGLCRRLSGPALMILPRPPKQSR